MAGWRRSGETAAAYAERNGLSVASLRWWSWRVGREEPAPAEPVELVPIEVVNDDPPLLDRAGAWCLTTREGDELYGEGPLSPELAQAVIAALLERRR